MYLSRQCMPVTALEHAKVWLYPLFKLFFVELAVRHCRLLTGDRFQHTPFGFWVIPQNAYITLQSDMQEISKMVNGWIGYLAKRPAR